MKYKAFVFLLLLISCLLLIPDSYSSNVPATGTPTCGCWEGTLPPDLATAVYGTVFTEIARRFPTATATRPSTPAATKTPRPTETVWRTEPVSTVASTTYTPLDIYGLENLPAPIVRPSEPSLKEGTILGEKINQYFKENNLQGPSAGVPVFVDQVVSLDVDKDGKKETAASYGFSYDGYSYAMGVVIFKDQRVIASTLPDVMGAYPETRLLPVQLSANQVGLFYHVTTATAGSGIYPFIHRRVFTFQNEALQTVWSWDYPGGARAGAPYRHFANEKIEFKHLAGQTYANILLTRQVEEWNFPDPFFGQNPANYTNYNLHLPGGLVFSFDGKAYRPSHYYDGQRLFPIHPVDFFVHAPRVSNSGQVSEDLSSAFHQIEYIDADGYGYGISGQSADVRGASVVWDEQYLDMRVMVRVWGEESRSSTIWVGLDTDLHSDFNDSLLNEDDYVFRLEIPDTKVCQNDLSVQMTYPERVQIPFKNQLADYSCRVDFRIPLDVIHLNISSPKTSGKVLEYAGFPASYPLHQYWPQAGTVIGFTVFSQDDEQTKTQMGNLQSGWYHPLPFDSHDPTTWGTLIFMADR